MKEGWRGWREGRSFDLNLTREGAACVRAASPTGAQLSGAIKALLITALGDTFKGPGLATAA